ncbi:nuclear transcription factor Y subunit C-4-like isoform X2 [Typha latifolia]|uniref:nuclear transcription factor Y subunit C-4-like isoform X2 n=1 Tax=Typha latifolia TaxID=4733 RepID=UPI003C3092F4
MDPVAYSAHFSSTSSPLMYNPFQVPQSSLQQPSFTNEVGKHENAAYSCGHLMVLQRHMEHFWQHQLFLVEGGSGHRQNELPLARIKRVMKSDRDVKKVSAETPVLFAKACELFISELTLRSWLHAEECMRCTIKGSDIAGAVLHTEVLDFLMETVLSNGN